MRRPAGFTIVEIIVVLLLMSILAATLLGRSVTNSNLDLNAATDKLRNHIRFAQAEAMKRSDTVWGIKFESGQYWLFRGISDEKVRLPGVDYSGAIENKVSLPTGISLTAPPPVVFFDRIGKPYTAYTNPTINTELGAEMPVTLASVAAGESRTIKIEPETGLVR